MPTLPPSLLDTGALDLRYGATGNTFTRVDRPMLLAEANAARPDAAAVALVLPVLELVCMSWSFMDDSRAANSRNRALDRTN